MSLYIYIWILNNYLQNHFAFCNDVKFCFSRNFSFLFLLSSHDHAVDSFKIVYILFTRFIVKFFGVRWKKIECFIICFLLILTLIESIPIYKYICDFISIVCLMNLVLHLNNLKPITIFYLRQYKYLIMIKLILLSHDYKNNMKA